MLTRVEVGCRQTGGVVSGATLPGGGGGSGSPRPSALHLIRIRGLWGNINFIGGVATHALLRFARKGDQVRFLWQPLLVVVATGSSDNLGPSNLHPMFEKVVSFLGQLGGRGQSNLRSSALCQKMWHTSLERSC